MLQTTITDAAHFRIRERCRMMKRKITQGLKRREQTSEWVDFSDVPDIVAFISSLDYELDQIKKEFPLAY